MAWWRAYYAARDRGFTGIALDADKKQQYCKFYAMTIDLNGAIGGVITGSSHALPIDALGELADRLIDSDLPIIHPERK